MSKRYPQRPPYTVQELVKVQVMANELLKLGIPPARVRMRLAEKGIRWEYQHTTRDNGIPQGRRERIRRLKQQGQELCLCGLGKSIGTPMCNDCLERKWGSGVSA